MKLSVVQGPTKVNDNSYVSDDVYLRPIADCSVAPSSTSGTQMDELVNKQPNGSDIVLS